MRRTPRTEGAAGEQGCKDNVGQGGEGEIDGKGGPRGTGGQGGDGLFVRSARLSFTTCSTLLGGVEEVDKVDKGLGTDGRGGEGSRRRNV
eukprot:5524531-Alexandrium_andersonii.AAC.1